MDDIIKRNDFLEILRQQMRLPIDKRVLFQNICKQMYGVLTAHESLCLDSEDDRNKLLTSLAARIAAIL